MKRVHVGDKLEVSVVCREKRHRVVHVGPDLVEPMGIDDEALAQPRRLVPLAPLHQQHYFWS